MQRFAHNKAGLGAWTGLSCIALLGLSIGCHADDHANSSDGMTSAKTQTVSASLVRGGIIGWVWDDADANGARGPGERSLDGVTVYLDINDDGVRGADEPSTQSDAAGLYFFLDLEPGEYAVRQEVPFGYRNVAGGEGPALPEPAVISNRDPSVEIIGGDETELNEYPFMVSVGVVVDDRYFHGCGGSLITDRWVVSAAHCFDPRQAEALRVLAGTNNTQDGSGQLFRVKALYVYPGWGSDRRGDMVLLELKAPVALRDSGLESVTMLSADNAALADSRTLATTIGWGASDRDSTLLQDVHLPIVDNKACYDAYASINLVVNPETEICGGATEGGIDACQGDSGGPLVVRDPATDRWMLAGVTSWGEGCALPGFPGVWARVSALSEWARATAVEPSRVHRLTVQDRLFHFIEFGNQSTRYQPSRAIEPRWQLTNLTVMDGNQPNQKFIEWRILDEAEQRREFICQFDSDGPGAAQPQDLPCTSGRNQGTVTVETDDGLYLREMRVSLDDTDFRRTRAVTVGTPPRVSTDGELVAEDAIDPDYPGDIYYIDYFDIADLTYEKAIAVQATSNDFFVYLALYDRDQRDANGSGGLLQASVSWPGEVAETLFFPTPGVNYAIGVSTYFLEEVGAYSVTVVNDGDLVPTSFDSEMAPFSRLRKLPEQRPVIPIPSVP
ncbi:MAG: trypsin-like serine protease [Proteobacteria bacterium]|nr:trypsin-like serine protease [Pseudomonadota bacterium]